MEPQSTNLPVLSAIFSMFSAILAIMTKDMMSMIASGAAILSAIFAIRHFYYSTKLSKKQIEKLDKQ